jgi:hypothetical protein
MTAYDNYFNGKLEDIDLDEEALRRADSRHSESRLTIIISETRGDVVLSLPFLLTPHSPDSRPPIMQGVFSGDNARFVIRSDRAEWVRPGVMRRVMD